MQNGPPGKSRTAIIRGIKHDAGRRDDISWMSLIRTARVPFAFQALVAAGLLPAAAANARHAGGAAETHAWRAWAAFPASMAVFGFLSWYWARATLSARFDLPDTRHAWDEAVELGRHGERPFVREAPLHIVPQAADPARRHHRPAAGTAKRRARPRRRDAGQPAGAVVPGGPAAAHAGLGAAHANARAGVSRCKTAARNGAPAQHLQPAHLAAPRPVPLPQGAAARPGRRLARLAAAGAQRRGIQRHRRRELLSPPPASTTRAT
ncbi:MAG: hypothetical protein WDN04_04435 [Rhodospirillales bacterium]